MNFSHNDILAFIEVAKTGNVSRAANNIGLTQPSVSKAIKRLEEELGLSLFERGAQGSRLTSQGLFFLESAKRYDAQHFELIRTAAEMRARHSGLLRIGMTSPYADDVGVKAIAEMVRRRPAMRIQFSIGKSDALNAAVEDGALDLAIVPSYPGHPLSCSKIELGKDYTRIVVRANHPLTTNLNIKLEDLLPYRWVIPSSQSAARRHIFAIFERHGCGAPHVGLEAEYISDAIMGIIMSTDLIGVVSTSVLRNWLGRIQPLQISELEVCRTMVLLSNPQCVWTPLMDEFKSQLLNMRHPS